MRRSRESKKYMITVRIAMFAAAIMFWATSIYQTKKYWHLLLILLLVPLAVIATPILLATAIVMVSYFGNKLHYSIKSERAYSWFLNREKTLFFILAIVLCISLSALLIILGSSTMFYIIPVIVFLASLAGFKKGFAHFNNIKYISQNNNKIEQIELLGIKIDAINPIQVLEKIDIYLSGNDKDLFHIITADSLALVRANRDKEFKEAFNKANLIVPDGAGIVWAADLMNTPLIGRVPGVTLVSQICEKAEQTGWKIFFVGGQLGIAEKTTKKLRKEFKINICGTEHGYFTANSKEECGVITRIKSAKPDIIFVALGVPRQEKFIKKLREDMNKTVTIGVGGSFDVISQTLPRAPLWMQYCGIEWLFRLWLEPKRFKRMLDLPVFVFHILQSKLESSEQNYYDKNPPK